jgi:hypothetical protein
MIEKAIRASVLELKLASEEGDHADALQRAIQASVTEASQFRKTGSSKPTANGYIEAGVNDEELEANLHRNVSQQFSSGSSPNLAAIDFDDSGVDTDDDENIKAAIERSTSTKTSDPKAAQQTDEDLKKAIELSKETQEEHEQILSKSNTEEEIVLAYMKRQSLAEEQHKSSIITKQGTRHDPRD